MDSVSCIPFIQPLYPGANSQTQSIQWDVLGSLEEAREPGGNSHAHTENMQSSAQRVTWDPDGKDDPGGAVMCDFYLRGIHRDVDDANNQQ